MLSLYAMDTIDPTPAAASVLASRAIGAMFFSVFGSVWLVLWCFRAFGPRPIILALIAAGTLAIFLRAVYRYRQNRGALTAEADSPAKQRANRVFNIVNAGQWIAILVAINVLNNIGLAAWVIPAAIFIIGLHFLPLAHVFSSRPHYVMGGALILLAALYPLLAPGGPANPIGCLGVGIILWAGALWAVTIKPAPTNQ